MHEGAHNFFGSFASLAECEVDDSELLERICDAYRHSIQEFGNHERTGNSQWTELNRRKQTMHAALISGKGVQELLRNPAQNNLFEGYENNFAEQFAKIRESQVFQDFLVALTFKALTTMLQNLGLAHFPNPEAPDRKVRNVRTVDDIIRQLEGKLGVELSFPNPFPGEYGIASRYGIISIRAVYALYQAYMTRLLITHSTHKKVVEIGAGLGRAAYFGYGMGLRDYTIYDLPLTNAAQAYFLGRTLGATHLTLAGESNTGGIRILNPTSFHSERTDGIGIVVCIDALTEMEYETALSYVDHATRAADVFYTINHEVNDFTARDIIGCLSPEALVLHHEHNLRPGYVEDIVFNRSM